MSSTTMQEALSYLVGERLTSVEFVMDYMRFKFDGPTLTILTSATLILPERTIHSEEYGFKEEVCRQITCKVSSVKFVEDEAISFTLDNDVVLRFSLASSEYPGPEAGQFDIQGKWWVF